MSKFLLFLNRLRQLLVMKSFFHHNIVPFFLGMISAPAWRLVLPPPPYWCIGMAPASLQYALVLYLENGDWVHIFSFILLMISFALIHLHHLIFSLQDFSCCTLCPRFITFFLKDSPSTKIFSSPPNSVLYYCLTSIFDQFVYLSTTYF